MYEWPDDEPGNEPEIARVGRRFDLGIEADVSAEKFRNLKQRFKVVKVIVVVSPLI